MRRLILIFAIVLLVQSVSSPDTKFSLKDRLLAKLATSESNYLLTPDEKSLIDKIRCFLSSDSEDESEIISPDSSNIEYTDICYVCFSNRSLTVVLSSNPHSHCEYCSYSCFCNFDEGKTILEGIFHELTSRYKVSDLSDIVGVSSNEQVDLVSLVLRGFNVSGVISIVYNLFGCIDTGKWDELKQYNIMLSEIYGSICSDSLRDFLMMQRINETVQSMGALEILQLIGTQDELKAMEKVKSMSTLEVEKEIVKILFNVVENLTSIWYAVFEEYFGVYGYKCNEIVSLDDNLIMLLVYYSWPISCVLGSLKEGDRQGVFQVIPKGDLQSIDDTHRTYLPKVLYKAFGFDKIQDIVHSEDDEQTKILGFLETMKNLHRIKEKLLRNDFFKTFQILENINDLKLRSEMLEMQCLRDISISHYEREECRQEVEMLKKALDRITEVFENKEYCRRLERVTTIRDNGIRLVFEMEAGINHTFMKENFLLYTDGMRHLHSQRLEADEFHRLPSHIIKSNSYFIESICQDWMKGHKAVNHLLKGTEDIFERVNRYVKSFDNFNESKVLTSQCIDRIESLLETPTCEKPPA